MKDYFVRELFETPEEFDLNGLLEYLSSHGVRGYNAIVECLDCGYMVKLKNQTEIYGLAYELDEQ